MQGKQLLPLFLLSTLSLLLTSCGGGEKRSIDIDGSSTVYPITEAIAEEYRTPHPRTRVTIGVSGTGGGFKKFARGQTDISDASRAITENEAKKCRENNIHFLELKVAFDGMAVLVNPENDWLDTITVKELKKIWRSEAQEKIERWDQVRPDWPHKDLNLYGPGVASGTYDYFTEAIVGESGASRGDFTASEDDNVLVQGISGDKYALGFFGLAYYEANHEMLKLVAVDNGKGGVYPALKTVKEGTYTPLSRPLYIYVSSKAVQKPGVVNFVNFYLNKAGEVVQDVGYIPLPDDVYKQQLEKFRQFVNKHNLEQKERSTQPESEE